MRRERSFNYTVAATAEVAVFASFSFSTRKDTEEKNFSACIKIMAIHPVHTTIENARTSDSGSIHAKQSDLQSKNRKPMRSIDP
jgi:hypothetical protein